MTTALRFAGLFLLVSVAPRAQAQIDYLPGARHAVSVGAFSQGGEASATGFEIEGLVSSRFALSLGVETSSTVSERVWEGEFGETGPAIRAFSMGARALVGRQGVNSPATVSLGLDAGLATYDGREAYTRPLIGVTVQTLRVLPPDNSFFVVPSGRFRLATIFDRRVAATTVSFAGGLGFGFRLAPDVLVALTPELMIAHGPNDSFILFSAAFGLTLGSSRP